MALIKCSECGKDVSDKASSCQNCGNPINTTNNSVVQVVTDPNNPIKIEPVLTSKKWKKVKIVAWCIIVSSFILGPILGDSDGNATFGVIVGIIFIGLIVLIVGSVGAWYTDKRTR